MSGPGAYRFATICLIALCAVLLISLIAVTAHCEDYQHLLTADCPSESLASVSNGRLPSFLKESHLFPLTLSSDKNKPQGSGDMQKVDVNSSELIKMLQEENKVLHKMVDEQKANLTALINKDGIKPSPEGTKAPIECPVDWHLFNNSCYLISRNSRNWQESQDYCKTKGAHLAIILTAQEQTFLWDLLPRGHWNSYWFGITDGETEDIWKWVDGSPLVGGFWEPNEPNNHINEDCGYIVKTRVLERVATESWYDAPCSMYLPFICEKEMGSNTTSH